MSKSPVISYIVIAYNVEKYLAECLDSILRCASQDIEVLVVDDVSPDRSGKIMDEYAARDARVRVIHREKNGGAAAARNSGLAQARGKWISFIDADDLLSENAVDVMMAHKDSTAEVVAFGSITFYEGHRIPEYKPMFSPVVIEGEEKLREYKLAVFNPEPPTKAEYRYLHRMAPWAKLFRRDFLLDHQIFFDERIRRSDDQVFTFQYVHYLKRMEIFNDCTYLYRVGQGVTYRFSDKALEIHDIVLKSNCELLEKFGEMDDPELKKILMRRCHGSMIVSIDLSIGHSGCHWSKEEQKAWLKSFCEYPWVRQYVEETPADQLTALEKAALNRNIPRLMRICAGKRMVRRTKEWLKTKAMGKKIHHIYRKWKWK